MLSHPLLLSDLGNIKNENINRNLQIDYLKTNIFKDLSQKKRSLKFPNDPVRNHFATLLTIYSLDFIFYHELRHLIHGHIEVFRSTKDEICVISETEKLDTVDKIQDLKMRRMFEWDADNGAISCLVNQLITQMEDLKKGCLKNHPNYALESYQFAFGTVENCIRTAVLCFYSIHRIYDCSTADFNKIETYTHPPAPIRQLSICRSMQIIFHCEVEEKYRLADIKKITETAILTSEKACALMLGNDEIDARGFLSAKEQPASHTQYFEDMFNEIERCSNLMNEHKRCKKSIM
jgi:hypothetical protein